MENSKHKAQNAKPDGRRRGFTLVEVLAAITIMAIVLPTLMYGISLSAGLALTAKQRNIATSLADRKLNELIATGTWQSGGGGDFGDDAPGYRWEAISEPWNDSELPTQNLQEVDVTVTWMWRHQEKSVTTSTLVYVPTTGTDTTGLGG